MFKKIRIGMNQSFKKKLSRDCPIKWNFLPKGGMLFCEFGSKFKLKREKQQNKKHKTKNETK
jgi:hypothetical protein